MKAGFRSRSLGRWVSVLVWLAAAGCTGSADKDKARPDAAGVPATAATRDKVASGTPEVKGPAPTTAPAEKKDTAPAKEAAEAPKAADASKVRRVFATEEHGSKVECVAFAPDGKTLASGSGDKTVRLWDVTAGKRVGLWILKDRVLAVAFAPNGKTVAVATQDGILGLWDVAAGKEQVQLAGPSKNNPTAFIAFAPDGKTLATIDRGGREVKLWKMDRPRVRATLRGHTDVVWSVAFSADSTRAVTASSDATARVWDLTTSATQTTLAGHSGVVSYAAFAPDGKTVATGGEDKLVLLWDAATGSRRSTCEGHSRAVHYTAFTPDSKTVVSAGSDQDVRLWDAATGKPRDAFEWYSGFLSTNEYPTYFALSPDGMRFATGSSHGLVVWDVSRLTQ